MSSYFDALERELVDAARRDARSATRARLRRPARPVVVALAVLALGVPAAAAVRQAFTPMRESDGIVRLSADTVVADGRLPTRGRWEMVASDSDVGRCLGIRFLDDSEGAGLGGGCGPPPGARLVVGSTGGGDRRLPYVFSGVAPAETYTVRIVDRRGRLLGRAAAQQGATASPGAYFAVETTVKRPHGCVQALSADGDILEEIDTDTLAKGCPPSRAASRGVDDDRRRLHRSTGSPRSASRPED